MDKLKEGKLRKGGFLVTKIRELSENIFTKILQDYNFDELTAARGRVLFPLWQEDDISFQELKKEAMLSKATLSYLLNKLERAGYIKRIPDEKDKRIVKIKLTKKNEVLQEKFLQISNQMRDIFYNNFSEKEIDEFESYLRRILDNLLNYQKN